MYLPTHFAQPDAAALHTLVRAQPFATLVHGTAEAPDADHVPLELALPDGADPAAPALLRGHVARANPLWKSADGRAVLAVFHGEQAYVSPGWYASKAAHGKVVPTWNYRVVHAHGTLRAVDDAPWLRALVGRLTDHHEAGRAQPWGVDDAPEDYVQQMLRAIVGIEIRVTRWVGKFKLSQNRDAADRAGVADGLAAEAAEAARAMAGLVPR